MSAEDLRSAQGGATSGWDRLVTAAPIFHELETPAEIHRVAAEFAMDLSGFGTAAVVTVADDTTTVAVAVGTLASALAGIEHTTSAAWSDAPASERVLVDTTGAASLDGIERLIVVRFGGSPTDLLVIADHRGGAVADSTLAQLDLLGSIAGGALAARRSMEQLRRLADLDALTGLRHRRAFRSRIAGWSDNEPACAVLVFDIDRFSTVNETFGHEAGDQLLIAVARAIESEMRADDELYRVGGDEFVALIDGLDTGLATHIAERCREATKQTGASVSIGVATTRAVGSLAGAYAAADQALTDAKLAGSDTIVTC